MDTITIEYKTLKKQEYFDIEIDKIIFVLSKLENNDDLKFESKEQVERLMKKYNLFDEYFLNNINRL